MTAVRCIFVVALLGLLVALAAGSSPGPGIAFETLTLKHLTAGELAPLLAPYFQFVGRTLMPAPEPFGSAQGRPDRGDLAGFVPEGVKLITAGNQSSHNLLVAGTAKGVAELRGLLSTIDAKPETLHLSVSVYPAPLSKAPLGEHPDERTELSVGWVTLKSGQSLSAFGMPAGVERSQIKLDVANGSSEFVPLPAYRGWPQVLLSVTARINADGTATLTVGAGMLEEAGDPLAAVRQARSSATTAHHMNLRLGERSVLVLARGNAGITVVIELAREERR
jgi:hypothetical protein